MADAHPQPPAPAVELHVPVGGGALVVADLHLARDPTPGRAAALGELASTIQSWTGPGALVLAGNTFATGAGPHPSVEAVLADHPRLSAAVRAWGEAPGRRVVVVPGDRDAFLAWSEPCRRTVASTLGAEVARAVDLVVDTGSGQRRVRVESGQGLDDLTAVSDPSNPASTPLAWHLRQEVIPSIREHQPAPRRGRDWLDGMDLLDDPAGFPRFVASRLTYRMLGRRAWLLLVPVVVAVVLRVPAWLISTAHGITHHSARLTLVVAATLVELALLAAIGAGALRRTWRALAGVSLGSAQREPNRAARDRARALIADGYRGLVTGHTCRPELSDLVSGFYANPGCVADVVTEHRPRVQGLGLPPAFLAHRQVSWLEMEAGSDLHARLLVTRAPIPGATLAERLATRRPPALGGQDLRPQLVATFPLGESWPVQASGQLRRRRVRRLAATFVAVAGFVSLVSAFSEPLRDRLHILRAVLPILVPEAAAALTALASVALLVVARGVRRGQRRAWAVTQGLLLFTVVTNIVKGVDVEEALVALIVAAYLWINRADFQAASDLPRLRRDLLRWLAVTAVTVGAGTIGIEVGADIRTVAVRRSLRHGHHFPPFAIGWWAALRATLGRMVGDDQVYLPHVIARFVDPTLAAASCALVLMLLAVAFRPVVHRRLRRAEPAGEGLARARATVERHGSGTLDYFALRPDKQFFFWGETVVAHAVYGTVCLVSPDPIGPPTEREPAWRAFRAYVDEHGWSLGGLGAGEEWLPTYRATGMHTLYVGDEGVVRTDRFSLEGGRFKGLRQAVNRIAKYGYTVSFHDPAHVDASLRRQLEVVMTKSRRGDVERGFSMTLGRVFDPADRGLLLTVVHSPSGEPVAFCQFVPAPGIDGYSLDLMRRDAGDHPNGLVDFAVVRTIEHLREQGRTGLGLNFATMRAVIAGEAGEGVTRRVQAWFLRRMGGSMQIESLWKFNAKFDPDWLPRFALYDAPENALAVAIAVARAESFWELPVIGRF
ncbi:MAG: phosphatidylglycerol lysyltransferase domain-containing protein, partial [Acidimicrobiales bacterium]